MRKNNIQTNTELIHYLIGKGVLKSQVLVNAIQRIDRKDFVIAEEKINAYQDYPLPIGYGQTVSQPSTVAFMLELLDPQQGEKILDIGSGSGRTTALLAKMVGPKGHVYGVDIIPELVKWGQENINKYKLPQAKISLATDKYGLSKHAPYNKILVSAAGEEIPSELIEQLKIGGKMLIPIKNKVICLTKEIDGTMGIEEFGEFTFVPLINPKMKR